MENIEATPIPITDLKHNVEAVSWDLTMGAAGTALGQMILRATSTSAAMVPEAMDHAGIIAYGYLFEYGDLGILKTPVTPDKDPVSNYPVFSLRSREKVGETMRSLEEFENWVTVQNDTFRGSDYNVVDNNCLIWATKACEFLSVPYPDNWGKICNWVIQNKTFAGLVGRSGMSSLAVSKRIVQSSSSTKETTS